jgi:hypothetical protein
MGTVEYHENDLKNFTVKFPDKFRRSQVVKHLTTKQEFHIPESQQIDDYRVDKAVPTEHVTYFELALCTLHAKTEVWVHW